MIGNYDYGFYWNFGFDGLIEVMVKVIGIVFVVVGEFGVWQQYVMEFVFGVFVLVYQYLFCV